MVSKASEDPQSGLVLLFTMSLCGVGLMSYLYLRTVAFMQEMKADIQANINTLHDLNENMNNMFLRMDDFVTKDEIDTIKRDDSNDSYEENRYQAWVGTTKFENRDIWVCIVRKWLDTPNHNKEWLAWDGSSDTTTIVRDYYLDTFESDDWRVKDSLTASTYETMVEGWNGIIRVHARVSVLETDESDSSTYYKTIFEQAKKLATFEWKRELVLNA